MTEQEFIDELAEALELECEAKIDDEFRDYDEWDSMMFLTLVAYLQQRHGFNLTAEIFGDLDTWRDLYERVK